MRYFIPMLLSLSSLSALVAVERFELDALAFGASYHFQNKDQYNFNQFNPGVGLELWYRPVGESRVDVGFVACEYENSYYKTSVVAAPAVRVMFGDADKLHWGVVAGIGRVTGYANKSLSPVAALTTGYGRFNLDATYIPFTQPVDGAYPSSAAVAVWLRVAVAKW